MTSPRPVHTPERVVHPYLHSHKSRVRRLKSLHNNDTLCEQRSEGRSNSINTGMFRQRREREATTMTNLKRSGGGVGRVMLLLSFKNYNKTIKM